MLPTRSLIYPFIINLGTSILKMQRLKRGDRVTTYLRLYMKYYLDSDRDFLGERKRDLLLDFECPRHLDSLRLLLPDLKWT
jgi:hypothetical protein